MAFHESKFLCVVSVCLAGLVAPAFASSNNAHLAAKKTTAAPLGFGDLCERLAWACATSKLAVPSDQQLFSHAHAVNRQVNRGVREVSDAVQYGVEEHWALPSARGGDCEDLALLKKKMLLEAGVPAQALLMATVLDGRLASHAVLVLRTRAGDFVLDNATNDILPWRDTGYAFLKVQNPNRMTEWNAVMAGGLFSEKQ